MKRLALAFAVATLTFAAHGADRITGKPFATRSEVIAQHGMVATSVPLGAARKPRMRFFSPNTGRSPQSIAWASV